MNATVEQDPVEKTNTKANQKKWLKRLGVAGFLFFLIKGLAWIAVIVYTWKGCE